VPKLLEVPILKKAIYSLLFLVLAASASLAQSRTMSVGDLELRLGMSRDAAMKALASRYTVSSMGGSSFYVAEHDQSKTLHILGTIGFENNQLTYISRDMDTSAWPNDEGFAVGRAMFDARNGSIPLTDSDGAKRGTARIVIANRDADEPTRGNIRTVDIFINERKITIIIVDGPEGKSVSASVAIRTKPW